VGATLLTVSMTIKETKLWSGVLWRAWRGPRAWCFFEATGVKSNGGSGEAPARCVFVVATVWQPSRGLVLVVSLRQVVSGVAAVRLWWTPDGGGPPGAVWSASFGSLSTRVTSGFLATTLVWMVRCVQRALVLLFSSRVLILNRAVLALELSCVTVSMPQSDRSELLSSLSLACVDAPIQPAGFVFVFFFA
jgi:hypothetical protein